jgi:c-di-GMP-binding flagellar brake protein YcgR
MLVDMTGTERRRAKRVSLSASFAEFDPRTVTPVRDLSLTGALIVSKWRYPIGTRIELRFVVFPDAPELFVHTGVVARHSVDPAGVGVHFDPLPPAVEQLIARIIARAEQDDRKRARKRMTFEAFDLRTRSL